MKIRLKAPAGLSSTGIYGKDGKEMEVGAVLDLKEEPQGWAGRYDILEGDGAGEDKAKDKGGAKTAIINPAEAKAPFQAKDKGGGWWAIYDADGKEVKSLRKDDAEIFNALSDEDKAAHVANLKTE
jgi:hypothetical protein